MACFSCVAIVRHMLSRPFQTERIRHAMAFVHCQPNLRVAVQPQRAHTYSTAFIPNRRQCCIAQHTAQLLEACDQGRAWYSNEETKSHCALGLGPERRARKQSTKCLSGDTLSCSKQCRTRISAAPQCHPLHSKDGICKFVAQRGLLLATAYHDVLMYLSLIVTATKVLPAGRTTDPLVRHY